MTDSVVDLWTRYMTAHSLHKETNDNINELQRIIDAREFSAFSAELEINIQHKDADRIVEQRCQDLIKQNDDALLKHEKKMSKLAKQLFDEGISVEAYHAEEILNEANTHKNVRWRKQCDVYLDTKRPCMRLIDNIEQRVPLGASGCKTILREDDGDIDILEEDDDDNASLDSELCAVAKVQYFNEQDDKNEIEEAYKSNEMAIKIGASFLKPDFAAVLKPHQREAVIAILKQLGSNEEGFLLAHAMGLGKSLTTICVLQAMSQGLKRAKILIICPKSLTNSWYSELDKWDEYISITYYPPIEDDKKLTINLWNKKGGILIMTHNRFRTYQLDGEFVLNPDILVIDEAHNLKNSKNLFYQAVVQTATKRKLLLTGTPLQNHLMEYYTMLNLISNIFDENTFKNEYAQVIDKGAMADAKDEDITAAKTKIKVFTRLTEQCVHRRSVAVLAHALPPMTDLKLAYKLSDMPNLDNMGGLEKTFAISMAAKDTKINLAKKLIKQIRMTGDLTLIFSKSKDIIETMSTTMGGMLMMTGDTSASNRRSLVESFMSKKSGFTEFCMTTQVGGLGLNLQVANRIIILDPTWNPVIDKQACFRAYRYGQTKPVYIYRFIVEDSIEERIYRCAAHKSLAACRVIDDQDVERLFTKAQLYINDNFQENILNANTIKDTALLNVMSHFSRISQHDILFAEANHEKLSDAELADAENEYNKIVYASDSRQLTHPISQLQVNISMDELFFPISSETSQILLVPPAVPVWKRNKNNFYDLLQLKPVCNVFIEYNIELEKMSPQGGIETRIETITPNMNTKVWYTLKDKGTCRLRVKMKASDVESEWSDWSAMMFA